MSYLYLALAIVGEVVATSFLKTSEGFTKPVPTVVCIIGYGIAFFFLSLTLRIVPTGVAYAIWSGVGTVLIALVAWLAHGQRPDAAAAAGMALIVCGVVVMNVFSRTGAH